MLKSIIKPNPLIAPLEPSSDSVSTAQASSAAVVASPSAPSAGLPTDSEEAVDAELVDTEEEDDDEDSTGWLDRDAKGFLISLAVHVALILSLAAAPVIVQSEMVSMLIQSTPIDEEEVPEFSIAEDIAYSDSLSEQVGANSQLGTSLALSQAPIVADVSEIPSVQLTDIVPNSTLEVSMNIREAVGLVEAKQAVRGMTGVGATERMERLIASRMKSCDRWKSDRRWSFGFSTHLAR